MLKNTLLLAQFELKKMLFNPRGLIALVAFSLVWLLILLYPISGASSFLLNPDFRGLIEGIFGQQAVSELFKWPVAEMAVYWIAALYIFPLFSIFVSADQFATDKSRGTFRFLTLRVGRDSLFFGRYLGHMALQSLLLAMTVIATIVLAVSRDATLLMPALFSGLIVTLNLIIVLLPYTALMALLSLYANSARQATIYAILVWALMSISIAIINNYLPIISELKWLLPGSQISLMINTQGLGSFVYAPVPLCQAFVLLVLGRMYINRSAL
ncbi:ABC transporter permease [Shewanella sp. Isolate13]|uniref:ABC transporter permease n=1 Tax=Shewanella sp. Isolate13 TaxID=2908531 RepID=UPI001EFD7F98|nr:ABC transporter permease subunit [Shewanella sp. Isolate13]MCG9730693.1 ABC transporter permease [Shewanella sp. Isolate13]